MGRQTVIEVELTGKHRWRLTRRFLRRELVVLQVEARRASMSCGVPSFDSTYWRNATANDVFVLGGALSGHEGAL